MERWPQPEAESPCGAAACEDHPLQSSLDYNTPPRSVRGNATNSPSSPFYKLSSELSRESLRIPGAVPFMWEQSPGLQRFPAIIATKPPIAQPRPGSPKFSTNSIDTDPAKPSLAILFQQSSNKSHAMGSGIAPPLAAPSVRQIAPLPATDHMRSSSASYSVTQGNTPTSSFAKDAGTFADAVSDSAYDVLTATACGVSIDDNLMMSGPLRLPTTPSDARDCIMRRFLPAAHMIACESPQTPSRRFLPPLNSSNSVGPVPQTPSHCNGSFREYGMATPSPSVRTSYSSMTPARRQKLLEESFHGDNNGIHQSSEEDEEEEEPSSTPKTCGIFPFHIHISLHIGNRNKRTSSSAKHQPTKCQQHNKKSDKLTDSSHTPKRIMDVLWEDQSSIYEDESPVHHYLSQQSKSERNRGRITAINQTAIHSFSPRQFYSSEPYPSKGRSLLNQNVAMQRSLSDLNHEEASEHGNFYDAPSRFCSPLPATYRLVNARESQASMYTSTLVGNPQDTSSSILGLMDNPHSAVFRGTEPHIESSLCKYNMHIYANTKPPSYHPHNTSSSFLTPQPAQESSSHESNISKGDNVDQYWKTFSNTNQFEEKPRIIYNALFKDDGRETDQNPCVIPPGMFSATNCVGHSSNGIGITQENESQVGGAESWVHVNGSSHGNKDAASLSDSEHLAAKNGVHDVGNENLQRNHHVCNGDDQHNCKGNTSKESKGCDCLNYKCNGYHCVVDNGCRGVYFTHNGIHCGGNGCEHYAYNDVYSQKGIQYAANSGQHNACNGIHYMQNCNLCVGNGGQHNPCNDVHFGQIGNGGLRAWQSAHYACEQCGANGDVHNVKHGDWHEAKMGVSSKLAYPPLPKSPTHSWLDRAMPLLVSANKSPNTSSRYIAAVPVRAESGNRKTLQAPGVADSKCVKGTHFQPGHHRGAFPPISYYF